MKKILCIHAHQTNMDYLDRLLEPLPCSVQHEVIHLTETLYNRETDLKEAIFKFLKEDIIACFLTCTVHCSLIEEEELLGVPILKIEDPIIKKIINDSEEKVLLFTNPDTVDLTMNKIEKLLTSRNYEVEVIPDVFNLIMKNEQLLYKSALLNYINKQTKNTYLMQLSMSVVQDSSLPEGISITTVYGEAEEEYRLIVSKLLKSS